jgi:hypothetical protein
MGVVVICVIRLPTSDTPVMVLAADFTGWAPFSRPVRVPGDCFAFDQGVDFSAENRDLESE